MTGIFNIDVTYTLTVKWIMHTWTCLLQEHLEECKCVTVLERVCTVMYDILTGAGFIRLISIAAVVAVAAHTDGGSLSCGAAVRRAL